MVLRVVYILRGRHRIDKHCCDRVEGGGLQAVVFRLHNGRNKHLFQTYQESDANHNESNSGSSVKKELRKGRHQSCEYRCTAASLGCLCCQFHPRLI